MFTFERDARTLFHKQTDMGLSKSIIGTIATVIIGGTAYTVSQSDVVKNLAQDTGMTQQQAQQYVNGIDKNSLESFSKLGSDLISDGNKAVDTSNGLDCNNYTYAWVSDSLPCFDGQSQLRDVGENEIALGQSYEKLDSNSASSSDISASISAIDVLNGSIHDPIVGKVLDQATITDIEQTNSYNKATLQAALNSK